jgi:hypothetical protein
MSEYFGSYRTARAKSDFMAAMAGLTLVVAAAWPLPAAAQSKGTFANYQPIGCYFNPSDKKLWVGTIGMTPKALSRDFYDDPSFTVVMKAGDIKYQIEGADAIVHLMKDFNYKGAEKYKFLKYSLVVDYSASIGVNTRTDILNTLDRFIDKLPLAIEGQLIRFSDKIEKFPFTSDKNEIRMQLKQPITYGMTPLHDALMEAATSLVQQGSNIPIRIIVIFTDGNDTSSSMYKDRASFISTFTNLVKAERIAVLAVGVTNEQDAELLKSVTDLSRGISGVYINVPTFGPEFDKAFDHIRQLVDNTVVFRLPKLGPDKGKVEISIASKSQTGSLTTLQIFDCEY